MLPRRAASALAPRRRARIAPAGGCRGARRHVASAHCARAAAHQRANDGVPAICAVAFAETTQTDAASATQCATKEQSGGREHDKDGMASSPAISPSAAATLRAAVECLGPAALAADERAAVLDLIDHRDARVAQLEGVAAQPDALAATCKALAQSERSPRGGRLRLRGELRVATSSPSASAGGNGAPAQGAAAAAAAAVVSDRDADDDSSEKDKRRRELAERQHVARRTEPLPKELLDQLRR